MKLKEMIHYLNSDLRNEYTHMLFYLHHAGCVLGLHRQEYQEFLAKQAESEMQHVRQFTDLIVGLGGVPIVGSNQFPSLSCPSQIIEYAVNLEGEVLENYLKRMEMSKELGGIDGMTVQLFMEEQFLHSREDYDHMKQMVIRV